MDLDCFLDSNSAATITFYKNKVFLKLLINIKYMIFFKEFLSSTKNNSLSIRIKNFSTIDQGEYLCQASSSDYQNFEYKAIKVLVENSDQVYAKENEKFVLNCSGNPTAAQWFKIDSVI